MGSGGGTGHAGPEGVRAWRCGQILRAPGGQRCVALIPLVEKRKPEEEWQQTAIQYSSDVWTPKATCVPWIHQLPP